MKRYARQVTLPQVELSGQRILEKSKVLIIGAGGLGNPAALYIAASGVGRIDIVDGDIIEESNLHRQVLFNPSDLGLNKATVLSKKIKEQNPEIQSKAYPHFLNRELALKIFKDYDLILDGTDRFSAKYLINDVCLFYNKPMIYASVFQFQGQLATFWKQEGSCYRCIYPEPPKTRIQNCAEAGILGPVVGNLGVLQALECLKVLLLEKSIVEKNSAKLKPLLNSLQIYQYDTCENMTLTRAVRKNCLCQKNQILEEDIVEIKDVNCEYTTIKNKPEVKSNELIDVREQGEWDQFHIPGSRLFPLSEIMKNKNPELRSDQSYYLICASGKRAQMALELLKEKGVLNIKTYPGGVYEY